jgi:hypothetical protein
VSFACGFKPSVEISAFGSILPVVSFESTLATPAASR